VRKQHTPERIKNKQTHIPFSKMRQPSHVEYNRYGTTSGMSSLKLGVAHDSSLKRMFSTCNEQNRLFRKMHQDANYRFGYYRPAEHDQTVETKENSTKPELSLSANSLARVFGTEAVRLQQDCRSTKTNQILMS